MDLQQYSDRKRQEQLLLKRQRGSVEETEVERQSVAGRNNSQAQEARDEFEGWNSMQY